MSPRAAPALRAAVLASGLVTGLAGCGIPAMVLPHAHAPQRIVDPAVPRAPLYLYPASTSRPDSVRPPCAFVLLFGNDVGFWRAHDRLATALSRHGYAVAGFDVRPVLRGLPHGPARSTVFLARVDSLLARGRTALDADAVPLVIAGHSIGGELALWTAAHLRAPELAPGLVGVLTMSPGARGHLATGLSDMLGREPHGADSFAVDSQVALVSPRLRVALVRGTRDGFRYADSAITAAGARRFPVEGQGHSMLDIKATGPVVVAAAAYASGMSSGTSSCTRP